MIWEATPEEPPGPPPVLPEAIRYRTCPVATYCLNCASVGELSVPLQPPIEMTAFPLDSSSSAALWSPTTAAAHFDDVAASAFVSAALVVVPPPPDGIPPLPAPDGIVLPPAPDGIPPPAVPAATAAAGPALGMLPLC